jgi:hypothetical protein
MCVAMRSTKRVCDCDPGRFVLLKTAPQVLALLRSLSLLSALQSGLVAPMSIDHGSKVTPIKAGPMAELAAMREQYANSGGVPPPPGAPTLPGEGHHCSARVLLSCGASQARAWLS